MPTHLIANVIHRYYPDWEAPKDNGKEWQKAVCPFHGDGVASAGISYQHNAFRCMACPVKGDAIAIIRLQEEVSFAEAKRIAEGLSEGSDRAVSRQPDRKPGRRVFADEGSLPHQRKGRTVSPGIRSRPVPWP